MMETAPMQVASPLHEPEMAFLMKTYKRELTEAFEEALASMPHRDRSVLRHHYVEGLSIDRLGELYQVHRATAARWIARATDALSGRTRDASGGASR
jgi:RNA polymerase sigma-70 factor, ECF subfamily